MISACLIVKNEEFWIAGCIDQLQQWVDEIVVVDTGSQDRTCHILQDYGIEAEAFEWKDDFSAARNRSLEKARGEWIFVIDPDERLSPSDQKRVLELTEMKEVEAFSFPTRNYTSKSQVSGFQPCKGEYDEEKNYPGYFESRKLRLFRNRTTTRFVGTVHELVEPTISGEKMPSCIPIHHYGATPERQKNKHDFYQKQTKKKVEQEPANWKAHFELGVEYLGNAEYEKAVESFQKARALNSKEPLILSNLGYALMEMAQWEQAQEIFRRCLELDPRHQEALLNRGVLEMRRGHWQEAVDQFELMLQTYPHSFLALRNLGNCYARTNRFEKSIECYQRALKIFPQDSEAIIDFGIVLYARGDQATARWYLQQGLEKDPQNQRAKMALEKCR